MIKISLNPETPEPKIASIIILTQLKNPVLPISRLYFTSYFKVSSSLSEMSDRSEAISLPSVCHLKKSTTKKTFFFSSLYGTKNESNEHGKGKYLLRRHSFGDSLFVSPTHAKNGRWKLWQHAYSKWTSGAGTPQVVSWMKWVSHKWH